MPDDDVCGEWFNTGPGVQFKCRRRRGHDGPCSLTPDDVDPFDDLKDIPHAHSDDPWQSFFAAENLSTIRKHCLKLLQVYATKDRALTDNEAAELAGIQQDGQQDGKRCSDLRTKGWIEWVRDDAGKIAARKGPSNRPRGLCVITQEGLAALSQARGLRNR